MALSSLTNADSIYVRAMDEAMNTQPRDMYPNPTSMMNNWWFRIAINKTGSELQFVHPAPVGKIALGWMETMKAEGRDFLRPVFGSSSNVRELSDIPSAADTEVALTKEGVSRRISFSELRAKHCFAVKGEVYDATPYLDEHPGGAESILLVAGDDATDDFVAIHSADAKHKLRQFHVGTLIPSSTKTRAMPPEIVSHEPTSFLNPKIWKVVRLVKVQRVNHDTFLYQFSLGKSTDTQLLGLPIGHHVFVRLRRKDTREIVQRAYTPVSQRDTAGHIDFLVKLYLPCESLPLGGKMTTGFSQLEVGDEIEIKGPLGAFTWQGRGSVIWKGTHRTVREIGMICGGSGITPILQVLRSIVHDRADETRVWLIDANKTDADILCLEELSELQRLRGAERLRIHHTLSVTPEGWEYSTGRITNTMLIEHLPRPSQDAMILACGPQAMITETVKPGLQRCGWDTDQMLVIF
ncbi:uncharacterized protein FIBRA_04807 [Fibroporia radiculosa]|uniref:Uncharacterized protein n=1 Tax=Fibroporia radiculosa TaxID=599839 RepID=J4IAD1_9APHY|nr:uncharacterized protein FIBRA_04807 [Fibroporia radiculosa]CCM02701.1 predicted protein [Fibroporia radiculosa]